MRYGDENGHYEIDSVPGLPQVAVSHRVWIRPDKRGNGIGKAQHRARLIQLSALGYDYALCTVNKDNTVQRAILLQHGWRVLDNFHNRVTDHAIEIWGRPLPVDRFPIPPPPVQ